MSLEKINALVSRLKQMPELNAFCLANYGKQPNHFIGLKTSPNANDLPALCYELRNEKSVVDGRLNESTIADAVLFIQVNNSEETEAGYTGLIHALDIADLIFKSIYDDQRLSNGDYFIDGELEIIPIYPRTVPFFTVAVQLTIIN